MKYLKNLSMVILTLTIFLLIANPVALSGIEDIKTGTTGTPGEDIINSAQPVDVNAILQTTSDEDVTTSATGINSLAGNDQVTGIANITTNASSTIDVPYVPMRMGGTESNSSSWGISGSDGTDSLLNLASIFSTSDAHTELTGIVMQIDLGVTGWPTTSTSLSVGLEGGDGVDDITNHGLLNVNAVSDTLVREAHINAVDLPLEMSVFGDGKTTATSTGIGMVADMPTGIFGTTPGGLEIISNRGTLSVTSTATSTTEQGMVELLGAARVDDSTIANAYAAGILGGTNDNHITNYQTLYAAATSSADMTSVEVKMKGLMIKPLFDLLGLDVGTFKTSADAVAVGIAGNTGNDTITNTGTVGISLIDVYGKAEADSQVYTFSISPPLSGGEGEQAAGTLMTGGLLLTDLSATKTVYETSSGASSTAYGNASTVASSHTIGMMGAEGNDTLTNNVGLTSRAESSASNLTLSVDVSLSKTNFIPLSGAAVANASTTAISMSSGIDGGTGMDMINNISDINTYATADADSLGIATTINGSVEGLSAGVSVTEASSTAMTAAKGIVGGTGGDTITNMGVVTSQATSRDDSTSVSVTVAGDKIGVAAGVTLADAISRASSYSFGIDGENAGGDESSSTVLQSDVITNTGTIRSKADAITDGDSVGVSFAASLKGISVSVALAETDVASEAYATGIRTGIGEDTVKNEESGIIDATATAESSSDSVSVAVSAGWTGVAMGASFAEANTKATSGAVGIESGDANDTITNNAQVTTSSTADVSSKSIAITAAVAPKGFSAGVAFSETETNSAAQAVGINAGDGNDTVTNTSMVSTSSSAATQTETIAINFAEAGAAIADVSSDANAASIGITGAEGVDTLTNSGTIVTTAVSVSDDTNASANLAGYASGDIESTSTAAAIGMSGGNGTDGETAGDILTNASGGTITVVSTANAYAENYVIQGGGVQFAKVGSKTDARATAMAGGVLGDTLYNDGTLASVAQSEIRASNFDFELFGAQVGSVGINALGTAIGMDGGAGLNTLTNSTNGQIHTYADLSTTALNTEASIGAQFVHSGVTAHAFSYGILGGADADSINNRGTINATGHSLGEAGGGSIGLISMSLVNALASADIDGIHAGGGNDWITNAGTITAGTINAGDSYLVKADTTAVAFDFLSFVSSSLGASATIAGIEGGNGHDIIFNNGTIFIGDDTANDSFTAGRCMVIGRSFGFGGQIAGATFAFAGSSARTSSFGINGGSGDDFLRNSGDITVKARSYADVDCETYIPFGLLDSLAQSDARSDAQATGIYGGDGWDTIQNLGTITVDALTVADAATDAVVDVFSDPHAESKAQSTARAAGIDGGSSGSKVFNNQGSIVVVANAGARPYAFAESDFMRTHGEGYGLAESTAYGITSGNVFNIVTNHETGIITVSALAGTYDMLGNIGYIDSDEDADIDAGYYNPSTGRWTPLSAKAYGIELGGGGDHDIVVNDGAITVSSLANGSIYANTNTWTRYPYSTARSVVLGEAKGIGAGRGSNNVTNNGTITVNALSYAAPKGYAWSRDYQATANAYGDSNAVAVGIEADGTVTNSQEGVLDVTARATSWANTPTNSEYANATAILSATATGFTTFSDTGLTALQQITNDGTTTVRALAGEDASGSAQQIAWVNTNITTRDSTANCSGTSTVDAAGIRAGDGLKQITNNGILNVLGRARADLTTAGGAHTYARSYYYNPEANSYATGIAQATGILATGGENHVLNIGIIDVQAQTRDVYAWSDSYSSWSTCYSKAETHANATGQGLLMGAGNDYIINDGPLTVTSLADAHSYAYADTRDNNLADEYETSRATSVAEAVGIHGGAGNNDIVNSGSLNVSAKALARVYAGGGHASVTASTESRASATGMTVGEGGSYLRNTGTIDVHALAYYINGAPMHSVSTVGILGSQGDDIIVNEGQIITAMYSGVYLSDDALAPTRPGLGIDAGAGDDIIILTDGSHITGDVALGPGDDIITLAGHLVVNGQILGGDGTDTLLFDGAGSVSFTMQQFNHVIKQGMGTYSVAGLTPINRLDVREGILQINSDYQFPETGFFGAIMRPDGSYGQLQIVGTGGLDGTLTVERQPGLYREHMTYDIITSNAINGSFNNVILPESTSLLEFSMEQTPDRVQVFATPQSCTSVASNKMERNIGEYLDRIIPQATGDLSSVLGTFQSLSPDEFSTAFASLSPALYHSAATATFDITSQYAHVLVKRMHSLRANLEATGKVPGASQNQANAAWIDSFGQWADQDDDDELAGYEYSIGGVGVGLDRLFQDDFLGGVSFGQSNTNIKLDDKKGGTDIKSSFGSIYGSWFSERQYLDTAFSYGYQAFDNSRQVQIGELTRIARSDHDGDVYSAYIETGRNLDFPAYILQPFAALRYTYLDEEGYRESGAGGINLLVDDRDTDSLMSDLGLRFYSPFKRKSNTCIPELTVAWRHDFDIDDNCITAAFEGTPGVSFKTEGGDLARDGLIVGCNVTLLSKKGTSVNVRYSGEFRSDYDAHQLLGGLRFEF